MAEIKLSREARRVIRRSDEPRRTHFNILLAEAALRVLRAEPELALPHKEEEMYVMGFDQAALDYARTVWAGIQRPLVRKIVFEPQELERPGAGTGLWAEAEALMGEAEKVAHRYGRTAKTSPPKEIRVAPARDRGSAAKASRTTPLCRGAHLLRRARQTAYVAPGGWLRGLPSRRGRKRCTHA